MIVNLIILINNILSENINFNIIKGVAIFLEQKQVY